MKSKQIIGIILMIPLSLLIIGSFGTAIYAAINKIQNITWTSAVIIGLFILSYIIGVYLYHKKEVIQ